MISLSLITFKSSALFVAGIFNLVLGFIVLIKSPKDLGNKSFFAISIGVFLWAISHAVFEVLPISNVYVLNVGRMLYLGAALIPVSFILFSTFWGEGNKRMVPSLYLPILFYLAVSVLVVIPNFIIHSIVFDGNIKTIEFGNGYIIYVLYIVGIFALAFYKIIQKHRVATGIFRMQTKYVVFGTAVSSLIGVVTNLLLPMYGRFELFWIGPTMTVVMVASIAYAILKHHLFSIKLVLVELAVLLLNMFLLFNVFTSHATADLVLNISVSAFVLFFSIILVRGIYKDIRDRERIEELAKEMTIANEKMKMMEQSKTEFVSIASHQLRTPLTVIKGYASMILEGTFGVIGDEVRDAMGKLYKSSAVVVSLVEDLLTVSRIEQGRMMLHFEPTDLVGLVQGVLSEMATEMAEAGIDVSLTKDENKQFVVDVDPGKFKQVVRHIVENAVKYTQAPGGVRVSLDEDSITNKVRLSVSDTGIGMTVDQIEALFERFNLKVGQGVNVGEELSNEELENHKPDMSPREVFVESASLRKTAPGIGLYIAKQIIDAHQGTLRIESAGSDKGTTVVVELGRG